MVWEDYYQNNCYGNVFYPDGSKYYPEDLHISDNTTESQFLLAVSRFVNGSGFDPWLVIWNDPLYDAIFLQFIFRDSFKILTVDPLSSPSVAPSSSPSASRIGGSDKGDHKNATALIAGIVGGVAGLALVVAGFGYALKRRKQQHPPSKEHIELEEGSSSSTSKKISPLVFTSRLQGEH